ncbi:MAG: DNA methyltransferase [Candidatus Hadarchaeota archaeon]
MRVSERLQLGKLATPLPDRERPIYRWFQIKESFSSGLVKLLAETWGLGEGDIVLDPFCGAGTTLLACKELGLDCMGFDVYPLFLLASRAKIRDYDVGDLKTEISKILGSEPEEADVQVPPFVARVFPPRVLYELDFFRGKVLEVKDEKAREFLLLGLLNAAMDSSWARKDGAAIKVTKKSVPPLKKALERRLFGMCRDIEQAALKGSKVEAKLCDAREIDAGGATAVITSPPYLAKQEYLHAYRIENWIVGLESPRPEKLVGGAGVGVSPEKYFGDMRAVIKRLHEACGNGARVCLVVSDGCFPDGPVEVCLRLSDMGEAVGFRAKQVVVVNKRQCTTPSRKKIGTTKEALLIWEK